MAHRALSFIMGIGVVLGFGVARAEEAKEEELARAWEQVQSYTADMRVVSKEKQGEHEVTCDIRGPVAVMKRGARVVYRQDLTSVIDRAGREIRRKVLVVFDGATLFTETTTASGPVVVISAPDPAQGWVPSGGKELFDRLCKANDVRFVDEQEVDKTAAYVFEVVPKNRASGGEAPEDTPAASTVRIFVARDSGIVLKTDASGAAGTATATVTFEDLRLNPDIDKGLFTYTIQEGTQVIDRRPREPEQAVAAPKGDAFVLDPP